MSSFPFKEVKLDDEQYAKYNKARFTRTQVIEQMKHLGIGKMLVIYDSDLYSGTVRQYVSNVNKWLAHHEKPRRLITRSGHDDKTRAFLTRVVCVERDVPVMDLLEEEIGTEKD
jgi:hypothetical protein